MSSTAWYAHSRNRGWGCSPVALAAKLRKKPLRRVFRKADESCTCVRVWTGCASILRLEKPETLHGVRGFSPILSANELAYKTGISSGAWRLILRGRAARVEELALWSELAVLDDDGRVVDLLSGEEVEWPPITN